MDKEDDRSSDPTSLAHDYARVIRTKESWHLGYWADRFGVTPAELVAAIRIVGPDPAAVQHFLAAHDRKPDEPE